MREIYRGHGFPKDPTLGDLLDQPESHDGDTRPGTFGELLRYGIVYFKQTRAVKPMPVAPKTENVIHAGLLEVVDA
jgi:hypothetical protein